MAGTKGKRTKKFEKNLLSGELKRHKLHKVWNERKAKSEKKKSDRGSNLPQEHRNCRISSKVVLILQMKLPMLQLPHRRRRKRPLPKSIGHFACCMFLL